MPESSERAAGPQPPYRRIPLYTAELTPASSCLTSFGCCSDRFSLTSPPRRYRSRTRIPGSPVCWKATESLSSSTAKTSIAYAKTWSGLDGVGRQGRRVTGDGNPCGEGLLGEAEAATEGEFLRPSLTPAR